MASNNNPEGLNQYKDCPRSDDERVSEILRDYDRRNIVNRVIVSQMLKEEHGILMSQATVSRRRKALGLKGSGATTRELPITEKRQLVLDQMAKDPTSRQGPATVKEGIAYTSGVHLTREFIREEMHFHDPEGFASREPSAKKVHRGVLVSPGIHHEWSGDGHDKLSEIGFPIWGIRDKFSGKWLGIWVVPNNRLKQSIAYLYLSLIAELGGMPVQTTTDCGSETTTVFGLANALREVFSSHLSIDELPAHRFLKSIYNITIERGWLQLRLRWGDNVKEFWKLGDAIYNPSIPKQYDLVQWLWPKLIQQQLDTLKHRFNDHRVRFDRNKKLPSGVSPNIAYTLHKKYGGENYLQPVNTAIVRELMVELGGEELIQFVSPEYAVCAQGVYDRLNIGELTLENIWFVYSEMLPLM